MEVWTWTAMQMMVTLRSDCTGMPHVECDVKTGGAERSRGRRWTQRGQDERTKPRAKASFSGSALPALGFFPRHHRSLTHALCFPNLAHLFLASGPFTSYGAVCCILRYSSEPIEGACREGTSLRPALCLARRRRSISAKHPAQASPQLESLLDRGLDPRHPYPRGGTYCSPCLRSDRQSCTSTRIASQLCQIRRQGDLEIFVELGGPSAHRTCIAGCFSARSPVDRIEKSRLYVRCKF